VGRPHDPAALARTTATSLLARRSRAGAHAPGSPAQLIPQRYRRHTSLGGAFWPAVDTRRRCGALLRHVGSLTWSVVTWRGSVPAWRSDLNRAVIDAWNQHGIPRRTHPRDRLDGGGGPGWAASQQALKVGAPRPAVRPCRRRQPSPIGCLAQDPGQHEQLACWHQLLDLATAGVDLTTLLVAGVGCGSRDGQQVGEPGDCLTGQPYVHLVLLLLRERTRWRVAAGDQDPRCPALGGWDAAHHRHDRAGWAALATLGVERSGTSLHRRTRRRRLRCRCTLAEVPISMDPGRVRVCATRHDHCVSAVTTAVPSRGGLRKKGNARG